MPTKINEDFIQQIHHLHQAGLSQRVIANTVGVSVSTVNAYVRTKPDALPHLERVRKHLEIPNGVVLIGSDAHCWPGELTTAQRGFIWACNQLQPSAVILNGDIFDGARISRFDPIGWEKKPTVMQELDAVRAFVNGVADCAGPADLIWTQGNHDARFETRLAKLVPEYAYIDGFHLKDHFPRWTPAMSVWINNNTIVKHRFKGGTHAAYQNCLHSGMSIATGHLHRALVTPFSDYRGLRYAIETGTLADPYGPQFSEYTEDNPVNWQSGFAVLTYNQTLLLPPEIVYAVGPGRIAFRGEVFRV